MISKPILSEFIDVIARPKFRQYADERTVEDFLKLLLGVSAVTDVKSKFNVTPDRGDNTVLATAYDGKADYIVSGDKHLLKLKEFRGIKIITVNGMLRILKSES